MEQQNLKLADGGSISWEWHDYARDIELVIINDRDVGVAVQLNTEERRKLIEALSYSLP